MKRSVRNLIFTALIGSALFIAEFPDAEGKSYSENICETSTRNQSAIFLSSEKNGRNNSDFWSKFRDSVMPDDKTPSPQEVNNNSEKSPPPRSPRN